MASTTSLDRATGLVLLSAALAACNAFTPPSEFSAETTDASVLEGNAEVTIPEAASDIHGYVDGFREVTTHIRFDLPKAGLDQFLSSTLCENSPSDVDPSTLPELTLVPLWWDPQNAPQLLACEGSAPHLSQQIFVSYTESDTLVIYVAASTR